MRQKRQSWLGQACMMMGAQGAGTAPISEQVRAIPSARVAPSFDYANAMKGTIDRMICADRELSILNRTMDLDHGRAKLQTPPVGATILVLEQPEFIANRNLCMKRWDDRQACIAITHKSHCLQCHRRRAGLCVGPDASQ